MNVSLGPRGAAARSIAARPVSWRISAPANSRRGAKESLRPADDVTLRNPPPHADPSWHSFALCFLHVEVLWFIKPAFKLFIFMWCRNCSIVTGGDFILRGRHNFLPPTVFRLEYVRRRRIYFALKFAGGGRFLGRRWYFAAPAFGSCLATGNHHQTVDGSLQFCQTEDVDKILVTYCHLI